MLIKFEVENFRSFNEKQFFHTVQRNFKRYTDHIYEFSDGLKLLKTNAIYGANAAGKTNLFKALAFLRNITIDPIFINSIEGINLLIPFRLADTEENESKFKVDFISNDIIYTYELWVKKKSNKVTFEKLSKILTSDEVVVFERITNEENKVVFKFPNNAEYKDLSATLSLIIPSFSTLLSYDFKFDIDIVNARIWFDEKVKFVYPIYEFGDIAYTLSLKEEYLTIANRIVKFSRTGIDRLKIDQIPIDIYLGAENLSAIDQIIKVLQDKNFHSFKDSKGNSCTAIKKTDGTVVILKLMTIHKNNEGAEVVFDLDQESRGTIVLLHLIPSLILSYGEGVNFFIDEIGTSLHPILLRELLSQYLFNNIKYAKGQLIFNTHEDFIMDENILRQDEIWLMEKGPNGNSTIFPLSDFPNVRYDLNYKKNYLSGRFGGVPFSEKPENLSFNVSGR